MEKLIFVSQTYGDRLGVKWEIASPKANVIIFEGMEEHASRYDKFALELNKANYNVYSIDTFGQGENAAKDGLGIWPVDGFNKQVDIYGEFAAFLNKTTGLPLYIFAHSMGSFMCQSFLIKYSSLASKYILCGSGGKNPILPLGYMIARLVTHKSNFNKKAKLLNNLMFANLSKPYKDEGQYGWLSVNKDNIVTYEKDPLCGFGPTNGFCLNFIKGMKILYKKKNLNKINKDISIFLIGGSGDPVTNMGKFTFALEKQYKSLNIKKVNYKIYDNMRHEILNESDWKLVSNDIINFYKG